jgi:predicted GTPase
MQYKLFSCAAVLFFSAFLQAESHDFEKTKQEMTTEIINGWKWGPQAQPVIVLIAGFPGAGKSELCNTIHNSCESVMISLDAIRQMLLDRGEQKNVAGSLFNWGFIRGRIRVC